VFIATFNNMSTISVLSEEETRVTGENHRPAASHWQTWSHNVLSSTPRHERDSNWQLSGDRHWLHRYVYVKFLLSGVQVNAFSSHKACKSSQILIYISITSISNLSCCGGDYFDKLLYIYIYIFKWLSITDNMSGMGGQVIAVVVFWPQASHHSSG
jgi:hypothetical protein